MQQHKVFKPGKLKFKPGFQQKIDKHTQKMLEQKEKEMEARQMEELFKEKPQARDTVVEFPITKGTGKISTSGKTVYGIDTKFKSELEKGDIIILTNEKLGTKEEKTICLILSDKSILLDQPFIEEQTAFGSYEYRKKAVVKPAEDIESQFHRRLEEIQKTKKIHKDRGTIDVRTKKGMWSYQVKKLEVDKNASREELLNMRSKISKDKHCW